MKKRIVALVLMLVMLTSLVACGGKEEKDTTPSLVGAYEQQADMTTGASDITMDFSFSGLTELLGTDQFNNISLKMLAVTESADPVKGSVELSIKYGTATDYTKLTTMIVDNEDVYINATELKTAVTAIASEMGNTQVGILLAMFPTEEYIKLNQTEMMNYATSMGVDVADVVPATTSVDAAMQQVVTTVVKHVIKAVEESTKEITPALVSGEGNKVTFTLTKENIGSVCDALAKADLAAYFDACVKDLEAIKGAEETVTAIKEQKDTVVTELKTAFETAKTEMESDADVKFVYSMETTGDKGNRVATNELTVEANDSKDTLSVVVKGTNTEKIEDSQKVTVPTTATTFEDLMNTFNSFLSQME